MKFRFCMIAVASFALAVSLVVLEASAEVAVIANAGVVASSLSASDLESVALGNKTKWDDGQGIEFVMQTEGEAHETFLSKYVGKSSSQFQTYWKKQIFTGKGKEPKSFATDAELADYVAKTAGAIGYVNSAAVTGGVKTLKVE